MESVLFVCSGNTCRSVMAEALFRRLLRERGQASGRPPVLVSSAGLDAVEGAPATDLPRQVLAERGIDLGVHRARPLNGSLVSEATWIVAMTRRIRDEIRRRYPHKADRVITLGEVTGAPVDVPDPFGGPIGRYRETADLLEAHLPDLLRLLEGEGSQGRDGMRIAIGSDHAGFPLKRVLIQFLEEQGLAYQDFGATSEASVDYPDYGRAVARAVAQGQFDRGILICGTGIGMSIVANKVRGIRAALCHEPYSARMSRLHNNANVLVLGGRIIGPEMAREVTRVFLETEFEGGRHQRRVEKIEAGDGEQKGGDPA